MEKILDVAWLGPQVRCGGSQGITRMEHIVLASLIETQIQHPLVSVHCDAEGLIKEWWLLPVLLFE